MSLRILHPGLFSLVVDEGRSGWRAHGVPVGGAADRHCLAIGNALVGNSPNFAGLEITLAGPTLEASCDLACVLYGAPFQLSTKKQKLEVGKTFTLHAGERLKISGPQKGMRAYLCIGGGIQTDVILGSRSAFEPVREGDLLPCVPGHIGGHFVLSAWRRYDPILAFTPNEDDQPAILRVIDGAQADWFPENFLTGLEEANRKRTWQVSRDSNRMGIRLEGPTIPNPRKEMISEPVCPGSVQVTNAGQCILLGVDGQTIGGYPKIAQVISADLDRMGQLRPGQKIQFVKVTLSEAEQLYLEWWEEIQHCSQRIRLALGR